MRERVLITGATGFVGRRLAADLSAAGWALTLAIRNPAASGIAGDVRMATVGEVGAGTDWREALAGVGTVIHAAAHVHVAPERAEAQADRFDEVNRAGSLALFDAAAAQGASLFVFLSSITVLGSGTRAGAPFTEATPPDPQTPYARSKLAAERELTARAGRHPGTRLVILRPPLICGPGVAGNLGLLLRLAATPLPLPLGGIHNRRTLLSLGNLSAAIQAVMAAPPASSPRIYVLGDREPLSTAAIVAALREGLGRAPRLFRAPALLMLAAASALGRGGAYQRLFGDLDVDAVAFRRDFGWRDATDTRAALIEAATAYRAR